MPNSQLQSAKSAKKDDFYTRLEDIELELKHYEGLFEGKVVYCNCDDYRHSQFVKYFSDNFEALGLKKLIATSYAGSWLAEELTDLSRFKETYKFTKTAKKTNITRMHDDGDFRSPECVRILEQSDIVVTNPPFSLFREYVAQLFESGKQFLIVGNANAMTYTDLFARLHAGDVWLGVTARDARVSFYVPDSYEGEPDETGKKLAHIGNVRWFTNMDHWYVPPELELTKSYSPEEYPIYDNYAAINVNRTKDIPKDYDGVMGVPITFLDKYNPDQFEIVRFLSNPVLNGKKLYKRIAIQQKVI